MEQTIIVSCFLFTNLLKEKAKNPSRAFTSELIFC